MRAEDYETAETLFRGGGEMGALLRSLDWSQTPLGTVETWSDSLKTAVQILLTELDRAKPTETTPREANPQPDSSALVSLDLAAQLNAFCIKLTDALRPLTDATEILEVAACILGEALEATRVIYTEVVSGEQEVTVYCNYTNGVAPLSGRYRLEDYRRNLTADHQSGRTQVVSDIPNHPGYTDAEKVRYDEIDIAAHIDVPLIKNNQFVALLAVHQSTPRQWTEIEVKQVEETAERTWAAVERIRAEAALRESEAKYRMLFESIDEGYFIADVIFDADDRPIDVFYLEANPAVKRITGLNLAGRSLREIDPNYESAWWKAYGRVAQTGIAERQELYTELLDSWFSFYTFKIGDADSRQIGCVFQDITGRKRTEQALRESEQQFRLMADAVPQIVWITDAEGRVEFFNKQWSNYTGVPYEPTTAAEVAANFVHPDDGDRTMAAFNEARRTGGVFSVEHRIRSAAGTYRWFLVRAEPYRDSQTGKITRWFGASIDIHDRKQTELEIQKFVSLADNSTEFIGMCDLNFVPFYVNEAGRQMVGLDSPQQYSETPVKEFFFPEDQDFIVNEFFPLVLHEGRAEVEIRFRHFQTGEALWMIYTVFYIRGEDSQPIGLATVSRNITDRKQVEDALRQSEARFRRIFECEMVPMGIYTPAGGIVEANNSLLNLIGYTRQELEAGQISWQALTPPEYRGLDEIAVNEVATRGVSTPYEKVYLHKDGREIPILIGAALLLEDSSSGVFFAIDLSERKKVEAELRDSETRYRLLAEAIPQLVWMTDAAGHNEYVNQRFCDYTGLTAEQLRGLNWLSIIHPGDLEMTHDRWLAAVNSGQFYEIEYRFRRHDGSYRWFLGQGIPLKDEQGRIHQWFGTCTDIEPQKQIEQARLRLLEQEQAAREQAENANRIKDEFLAVLSHELRSPLNPILGWARLLQQGNLDATRTRTALATIERNAQLQAQLIDDLLDISRILRGKLSLDAVPVDLSMVIAAALETVHLAAEAKSLPIQTTISPDVGAVMGDAGRLQQVVWNLLSNAVKFTPQGGQIMVILTQAGTYAQIQVSDTGKGIAPDFLPYVFEHFRQEDGATTRKFGGLGLGLAIARQIVELHGGQINVDSPGEGQGATFTVQIPLAPQSNELPSPKSAAVAVEGGLQGIRILVVDDELDSREFVAFVLEQAGAIVTTAASGHEALQALALTKPDILLSDVGMPEMDGYTLLRQIRAWEAKQGETETPVRAIALTAYAGEVNQQQALAAGFQTHLSKPVSPGILIDAVNRCNE